MSTEKSPSGEQSTETERQGTADTVGELATQNQTGGTAGQTLPTATSSLFIMNSQEHDIKDIADLPSVIQNKLISYDKFLSYILSTCSLIKYGYVTDFLLDFTTDREFNKHKLWFATNHRDNLKSIIIDNINRNLLGLGTDYTNYEEEVIMRHKFNFKLDSFRLILVFNYKMIISLDAKFIFISYRDCFIKSNIKLYNNQLASLTITSNMRGIFDIESLVTYEHHSLKYSATYNYYATELYTTRPESITYIPGYSTPKPYNKYLKPIEICVNPERCSLVGLHLPRGLLVGEQKSTSMDFLRRLPSPGSLNDSTRRHQELGDIYIPPYIGVADFFPHLEYISMHHRNFFSEVEDKELLELADRTDIGNLTHVAWKAIGDKIIANTNGDLYTTLEIRKNSMAHDLVNLKPHLINNVIVATGSMYLKLVFEYYLFDDTYNYPLPLERIIPLIIFILLFTIHYNKGIVNITIICFNFIIVLIIL
ncbi:unnamed protein product [Adineta steineri]|uniref:Uncharacterized protein n=1 Tax=Adineta steineri TaxID=433720 RepID=A0A819TZI5_9BILA|nr:unnamed protein product [Adineta steineri]CAF4081198.1 unnamed protein product [Adineta steineri]